MAAADTQQATVAILFPEQIDEVFTRLMNAQTCNQDFHRDPERSADFRLLAVARYHQNLKEGFHHSEALRKAEYDTLYK